MAAKEAWLDVTGPDSTEPDTCPDCGETTRFQLTVVITQRIDPSNVIGRHTWTRCVTCEPFTEEELAEDEDDEP